MPTSAGLAGPSRPASGVIIGRAMLLLQKAHSGFHGAGRPLIRIGDQGTDFEWTDRRHEAFGQLKNALTSAPILGFPREDRLWYLDTDASDVGTGAVQSRSPGRRGTGHCLCQQVAGRKRAEVLQGPQGAVGGGSGPQAL